MYVLRQNSPHKDEAAYKMAVEQWQDFLRGQDFDVVTDGDFGPKTWEATQAFQQKYGLTADGVVGNRTYGKAMELGLDLFEEDTPPTAPPVSNPNWPPPPPNLTVPGNDRRVAFLGRIEFVAAPQPGNREAIRITNNWNRDNIVKVVIPQLIGVTGAPPDGEVFFHKKVADAAQKLFVAWEQRKLMDRVLTWGGSYVPRFIRGSTKTLSNHAYGSAFDINAAWNPLGTRPAMVGKKGCVRELVQTANEHGFYWGGHYRTRPDGMHFEFARF